jgi:DNA-binding MarR family transcriptional regulator
LTWITCAGRHTSDDADLTSINMTAVGRDRLIVMQEPGPAMTTFGKLHEMRAFQRRQLPLLHSIEDFDVIVEIGYYEDLGRPLTLKRLFLQNVGSVATVQRRLSRLKRLGIVLQTRSRQDRRNLELTVSPEVRRLYRRMDRLLARA